MYKNIVRTVYKVSDLLSWYRNNSLILSPSFQRRPVWKPAAKSFLIDTVVRGLPMPIIFLREQTNLNTLEPIREVVDGQQRLRTLIAFVDAKSLKDFDPGIDDFTVKKIHNEGIAGRKFSQLDSVDRKKILDYEFSVHVLPSETEDREVLQIFARMNATGVKLTAQEIRNAEFFGVFKKFVYKLAYEQLSRWRNWKIFTETDIARMAEVEETSDYIISMLEGLRGKSQKTINKIYRKYEDRFDHQAEIDRRFTAVMNKIDEQLGNQISSTEFSRKVLFQTLFVFYYDLMYGLGSNLERMSPAPVPIKVVDAIDVVSRRIHEKELPKNLAKFLRGSTASYASRKARLDFIERIYQG